jgi:hypothetical protein
MKWQPTSRSTRLAALAAVALVMLATAVLAESLLPAPDMNWYTVDHGGGTVSGDNFSLSGTIGQMDAGQALTGDNFSFTGGFWAGVQVKSCAGDVAPLGGDGVVNIDDLLLILGAWGTNNPQFDIAPSFAPNGRVDMDDLLVVITSWGACPN